MGILSDLDAMVVEMMNEFGSVATLITILAGTYDTATGETIGTTTIETPVRFILMDYPLRRDGVGTKFGGLVEDIDKMCYVQPANKNNKFVSMPEVTPTSSTIRINNQTYKIVVAKDVNPTATDSILLELYIRK